LLSCDFNTEWIEREKRSGSRSRAAETDKRATELNNSNNTNNTPTAQTVKKCQGLPNTAHRPFPHQCEEKEGEMLGAGRTWWIFANNALSL